MNDKSALRSRLRATRDAFALCHAGDNIVRNLIDNIDLPQGATIAGYHAMGSEINPSPLLAELASRYHSLSLPCVTDNGALIFKHYSVGDRLVKGRYGNGEPIPDAPIATPSVILVPLLGFDNHGHRLGQGGGNYDRTLSQLRAAQSILAIGLAWSCQEVDNIPNEPHDQLLDWVVTEQTARKLRGR